MGAPLVIPNEPSEILEMILNRFQLNEETVNFSPEKCFSIIKDANVGANFRQSKVAEEIIEKDPDIGSAIEMRMAAIMGTTWTIVPAESADETDPSARAIKQALDDIPGNPFIGLLNFQQLIGSMAFAALTGFGMSSPDWAPGGNYNGFLHVSAYNFSFWKSPYLPRLRVQGNQFEGIPVTRITGNDGNGGNLMDVDFDRMIYHRHYTDYRDVARSGLIRPLIYMYLFNNINTKDLLRFREKFGMPFLMAQMANLFDSKRGTLTQEAKAMKGLLQNFANDASGLFSDNMTLQAFQAGNVEGKIFFESDEKYKREVSKMVLGQTSSQDSVNSNRSTAQVHNLVRNDIRVSDTNAIASTLNQQVIPRLSNNILGPDVPSPRIVFQTAVPQDQKAVTEAIEKLAKAGIRPSQKGLEHLSRVMGDLELEFVETPKPNEGTDENGNA